MRAASRAAGGLLPRVVLLLAVVLASARTALGYEPQDGARPGVEGEFWFGDVGGFARAGELLLHGDLAGVYADPWNQAGPLQVLLSAWGVRLAVLVGYPTGPRLVAFLVALVTFAILAWASRRLCSSVEVDPRYRGMLAWGPVAAVLLGAASNVPGTLIVAGHWMQVPVVGAWLAAGWAAARSRPVLAGVLIGAGCLLEPWAVLGILVLVVVPRWRERMLSVGVAATIAVLGWAGFLVQPGFAFLRHDWQIKDGSLWTLMLEPGAPFGWPLRLAQGALIVGVVAVVWARLKGRAALALPAGLYGRVPVDWIVWAVALLVLAVRLVTDPKTGGYYTAPVNLLIAAALPALVLSARPRALTFVLAWVLTVPFITYQVGPFVAPLMTLVLVLAGLPLVPGPARTAVDPPAPGA